MSDRSDKLDLRIGLDIVENRRIMVEALRSGEHFQLRGSVGTWWRPDGAVCFDGLVRRLISRSDNPGDGQHSQLLGITSSQYVSLIHRNDSYYTFSELADILEMM